jgi:hypothetical protein
MTINFPVKYNENGIINAMKGPKIFKRKSEVLIFVYKVGSGL